ncbi:baeRF2 domain-containing protein [Streptomyces meridianus]|uniref:Peptide chain release factor 1 n=1 Tax=Streptomyces meridianus TaxID=2938945 RepID=A0ABT0X8X1_9ACTN|nr:hypothetical protein [Streptomyces meridianus]MCM2578981.1 hypothetical protein [Streptomyces meridianus]
MRLSLLEPLIDRPGPWASVYTEVPPASTADAVKQRELSARALCDQLTGQGADAATCNSLYEALSRRPEGVVGSPGRSIGRAVFATEGKVLLDTPMPGPPPATLAAWSALPRIAPLLDGLGEDPVCLVVHADRSGAEFELRRDLGRDPAGRIRNSGWPVRRTSERPERHYRAEVDSAWEHTAQEIADATRELWEQSGCEVLLLVGEPWVCHAVRDRMPEPLRSAAAETEHTERPGSPQLERDIAQVRAVHEVEHIADVLDRYLAGRADHGGMKTAVESLPALVQAAREHRIDTLLLAPGGTDLGREVWVGADPDQLGVRSSELHYLGEMHPQAARADDALLRSAAANGAEAVVVHDPAEAPVGGIGALLRWPAPDPH